MTFIKDIFDKLFPQKGLGNQVVHNEVIDRSEAYIKRYRQWQQDRSDEIYGEIATGYEEKLFENENSKVRVHLLVSKYSNGIAISYDEDHFTKEEFSFLFDSLAERVGEFEKYRTVNSDYIIKEKGKQLETKEKYYLKPLTSKNDTIVDQQFGNILIEHILIDDKPSYIKLMANVYSDSKYSEARTFSELIKIIF
ncbi:MAG: hypothetical protein WBA74_17350 [Cyclobacteriaceae bacterium]